MALYDNLNEQIITCFSYWPGTLESMYCISNRGNIPGHLTLHAHDDHNDVQWSFLKLRSSGQEGYIFENPSE